MNLETLQRNQAYPSSSPVDDLAERMGELLFKLGAKLPETRHRDRTPDYKRESGHQKIPSYSGEATTLSAYKQDVKLMLSLCSPGACDQVVPHLVNAASPDFKKRWLAP